MAGNKQDKEPDQQLAALHLAGEQHKRQRHDRHDPRVDGQHNADLGGLHAKAVGDI